MGAFETPERLEKWYRNRKRYYNRYKRNEEGSKTRGINKYGKKMRKM